MTEPRKESSQLFKHYSTASAHVVLEWEHINLSILAKDAKRSTLLHTEKKHKMILRDCNGRAESGQLLAIMGPTGCGKTSLLNVLAGRVAGVTKTSTRLLGKISVNGRPREDATFRRISAYVMQDDRMYAHLTVYETLMLAAHFYLPQTVTLEQKDLIVTGVIQELGLVKARNTIIGDEKVRGVSGGERKRANVGVQLISDPLILFLDEPTSGLDSFQAQAVMSSMKALASHGRLVVTVIHQPRSSIYDMFDQLLLLSEGRTVFLGPASEASPYFTSTGHPCPRFFNPSDFFLDVLSPDTRSPEASAATYSRIAKLSQTWVDKRAADGGAVVVKAKGAEEEATPKELVDISTLRPSSGTFDLQRTYRNFTLLCWRAFSEQRRDIATIFIKLTISIIFALVIGGIYSNSRHNNQKGIQSRTGLLFIVVINQGFNGAIAVLNSFPKEKIIVNRERAANAYGTLSYFAAKFIVELPLNVLPCFIFGTIIYWIAGLNPNTYGYFILILMLEAVTAVCLGLAISALMPNVDAANAVGTPCIIIALLFGGYYINIHTLPIVANWIPYVSFMRWAFEAVCINEYKGETFSCSGGATSACFTNGEEVLESLSFNDMSTGDAVFGLAMVLIAFACSAMLFIELSKLTYVPLGHVGREMRRVGDEGVDDDVEGYVKKNKYAPLPQQEQQPQPQQSS